MQRIDGPDRHATLARFWPKVVKAEGNQCWLWNAATGSNGYGQFRILGRSTTAHRAAWLLFVGPLSRGQVVDHLCRNPSCVNPAHLEAVTYAENTRRGTAYQTISARRRSATHCKRGHPLFGPNLIRGKNGKRCCRECQREKGNAWRTANRDRINEMQRVRRAKNAERRA